MPSNRRLSRQHWTSILIFVASLATGLLCWQISSLFFNAYLLPPPRNVFLSAVETIRSGELLESIGKSYIRIFIGFVIGCFLGIGCGLLMGTSNRMLTFAARMKLAC